MGYDTHQDYIRQILEIKSIETILEFGMGHYSTGMLISGAGKTVSIEMQSKEWYDKIVENFGHSPKWEHHLALGPMTWTQLKLPQKIDFGFVDGHGDSRPDCINFLMGISCPIILAHDTEYPGYCWNRIMDNPLYKRLDFKRHSNWTSLWTMDNDLVTRMTD